MGCRLQAQIDCRLAFHTMDVLERTRNNDLLSCCWLCLLDEAFTSDAQQRLCITGQTASDSFSFHIQKILPTLPARLDLQPHDRHPRIPRRVRENKTVHWEQEILSGCFKRAANQEISYISSTTSLLA